MSGMPRMPYIPTGLGSALGETGPKERVKRAIKAGHIIVDRIDFWLAMRAVWFLAPFAALKLDRLGDDLNRASDEAEAWLGKPATVPTPARMKMVATSASTSANLKAQTFIDCAGRQYVRVSTGY
jgi:hypothetical protein